MIEGGVLSELTLQRADGTPYPVKVISPVKSTANIDTLSRVSREWLALEADWKARGVDADVVKRAHFGSNVLFIAGLGLATKGSRPLRILVATHDDEIVGLLMYEVIQKVGDLAWLTVAPQFLAGAPTPPGMMVRGIGTNLTCIAARRMRHDDAKAITLEPFDDAARTFWTHRGFADGTGKFAGHLVVDGPVAMEELAESCTRTLDDPAQGHVCICGTLAQIEQEARARMVTMHLP